MVNLYTRLLKLPKWPLFSQCNVGKEEKKLRHPVYWLFDTNSHCGIWCNTPEHRGYSNPSIDEPTVGNVHCSCVLSRLEVGASLPRLRWLSMPQTWPSDDIHPAGRMIDVWFLQILDFGVVFIFAWVSLLFNRCSHWLDLDTSETD